MKNFRPQAILLDFYGTIVEEDDAIIGSVCDEIARSSPVGATAAEIGAYWGREFSHLCWQSFGVDFRAQKELEQISLERVLRHFEANLDVRKLSQPIYEYWARPQIYPESRAALARCRVPVCIVSNIDNTELEAALKHHALHFDWIVTSEDCRAYKPRGEMFDKALSVLGLPADKVLHVGDSLSSDVRGAKAQGIAALWVNRKQRGIPGDDQAPDYVADNLTGLLDVL